MEREWLQQLKDKDMSYLESCAWESVARGGICGAGVVGPGVVGEGVWEEEEVVVGAVVVGNGGAGVPGVGEERSQWRMAPSEPPETRMGWTGCHANAVYGICQAIRALCSNDGTYSKLLFCDRAGRLILSLIGYRIHGLSGHAKRSQANSHAEPMRGPG